MKLPITTNDNAAAKTASCPNRMSTSSRSGISMNAYAVDIEQCMMRSLLPARQAAAAFLSSIATAGSIRPEQDPKPIVA
jgi:hypothetical protein